MATNKKTHSIEGEEKRKGIMTGKKKAGRPPKTRKANLNFNASQLQLIEQIKLIDKIYYESDVYPELILMRSQGRVNFLKSHLITLTEKEKERKENEKNRLKKLNSDDSREITKKAHAKTKKSQDKISDVNMIKNETVDYFSSERIMFNNITPKKQKIMSIATKKATLSLIERITDKIFSHFAKNPRANIQEIDISALKLIDGDAYLFVLHQIQQIKKILKLHATPILTVKKIRCPECGMEIKNSNKRLLLLIDGIRGVKDNQILEVYHEECYHDKYF